MIGLPGGIEQGGLDVLRLKKGVVAENLLVGGAGSEKLEQIHDAKPGAADAGTPATFAGFDGDAFEWFHGAMLLRSAGLCQRRFQLAHSAGDFPFQVRESFPASSRYTLAITSSQKCPSAGS